MLVQRALAVMLTAAFALAPALVATAHPTDCDEYASGFARSCRGLPSGQGGVYVATIGFFAFAGSGEKGTEAGAGSLAGGTVRVTGSHVTALAYANTVVAFDTVTVRVEPAYAGLLRGEAWGVRVDVPVDHVGFRAEERVVVTAFGGDADGDGKADVWVSALGKEVRLLP